MNARAGTTAEWEPEHTVSATEAAELIGTRFPSLRGASVEAVATGWDNTVFLVGDEWVFRFPRRSVEVERVLAEGERLGPYAGVVSVCHGDLHVRHLLVDDGARAAGVIDWGDLCVADPSVDLSLAYGGFAGPARTVLLSAYGPVGAERELRARVLAVFLCAALAEYAAGTGRARLLDEALAGLGRAAAC